jgi:hypothetical protein
VAAASATKGKSRPEAPSTLAPRRSMALVSRAQWRLEKVGPGARNMSRGGLVERPLGNAHCDEMAAIAAMQVVLALGPVLSQGSPEANMLLGMTDSNSDALDPGPQGRCVCGFLEAASPGLLRRRR